MKHSLPSHVHKIKEEKEMRKSILFFVSLLMALSLVLAACAPPEAQIIEKTVEVEVPVEVTVEVEKIVEVEKPVEEDPTALPRNETMYFNGQQWGPVVGWNPYSSSNNNAMAIAQNDSSRVIMFETP